MSWIRDRGLTLVLMGCFAVFLSASLSRASEYNARSETASPVNIGAYLQTGHPWEASSRTGRASSCRWRSSSCSRRGSSRGLARIAAAWRHGAGGRRSARLCQPTGRAVAGQARRLGPAPLRALAGLAFVALFLVSWAGHALGGSSNTPTNSSSTASRAGARGLPDVDPLLVRVVPELAERVPRRSPRWCGSRSTCASGLAGVQAGACAARRDRAVAFPGPLSRSERFIFWIARFVRPSITVTLSLRRLAT